MKFRIVFISGTLLGLAVAALEFVKKYAIEMDYKPFSQISSILLIIFIVYVLYRGIKEIRDRIYDGGIKFSKAFLFGAEISFVAFLIVFLYLILHYNYIDVEALQRFNERNATLPPLPTSIALSFFSSFSVLLYGIFLNLFVSMYVYRKKQ